MNIVNDKVEIEVTQLMKKLENVFGLKYVKKPIIISNKYNGNFFAGSSQVQNNYTKEFSYYLVLNNLYCSRENGKYYVYAKNTDLLKMRITHELVHLLAFLNGKNGIENGRYYELNCANKQNNGKVKLEYNLSLNEGMTQMFTDYALGKTTNFIADGYFDYKKIAQILSYFFGGDVMISSYFGHSDMLKKVMDSYCNGLYDLINRKLTFASYIHSFMPHFNVKDNLNANLKIETDICKSLRNDIFDECLELIISNLFIPWIKNKDSQDMKKEVETFLEIFNDNITLKNKVMFYLMKNYKNDTSKSFEKTQTDITIEHIIAMNNDVEYDILDNGLIINKSTNKIVPYNERLYEYFYSKKIDESYWNMLENAFNAVHSSNNTIKINIDDNKSLKQRRILLMTVKQFMKKNGYVILNDLDCLDTGNNFELSYVNEKLTMSDIIYIIKNYSAVCLPQNNSNILKIIDRKTNREVVSSSLISKCRVAFKVGILGLSSPLYQDKWDEFTKITENQISSTGMIKKVRDYNNPFYSLFNDGYGCEWFYEYMRKIPISCDVKNQEVYLSENEMNNSMLSAEMENDKLSQLFTSFAESFDKHKNK